MFGTTAKQNSIYIVYEKVKFVQNLLSFSSESFNFPFRSINMKIKQSTKITFFYYFYAGKNQVTQGVHN